MRLVSVLVALLVTLAPAMARDCAALDADARTAESAIDLDRLAELFAEANRPDIGCDSTYVAGLGEDIAKAHVNRFFRELKIDGNGPDTALAKAAILEAGRQFGEPWQLTLTLAEVRYEANDFNAAAPLYQAAVADMSRLSRRFTTSSLAIQDLPSVDDFKVIHGRMVQAALLADDFAAPALTRSAPEDGLMVEGWRGYQVKAVALPVQYEFGTTRFTDKGRKAAEHLLTYLKTSGKTAITLVGHTDPVGAEAANQELSMERAGALRDFLKAGGYPGEIKVEGRGESEPFRAVDAARFATNEEALNALDRRVELVR